MKTLLAIVTILGFYLKTNETITHNFDVYFNNSKVGTVKASKAVVGKNETIDIRTNTDTKLLMLSVHVESEINMVHEEGALKKGVVYRHASRGNEDIVGSTTKQADKKYVVNINNKTRKLEGQDISFCVAHLYFKEPLAYTRIYSNMYGDFLPLVHLGNHRYKFVSPDNKVSIYSYTNGELTEIEVELSVGKVVSKRTS